jgi:threonine aldolase
MFFASDNTGPVHPNVMAAMQRANDGYAMPYGADDIMVRVTQQVRDVFEAPEAVVYLVALGTAANALILATLSQPWETVFCHRNAHIHEDECNAPEFYSGGGKLTLVDGANCKMDPALLRDAIEGEQTRGVHGPQRGPVSITQATEKGTVHSVAELKALTMVAKEYGLATHMDGARFANALVKLGCSAAEMTWKAGIDAVSFGGTKNGLMGVEAVVFFDPKHAWEFELRRKRAAHLFSKHRFLSAQMEAYLTDGLWLELAEKSNAACARLARGLKQVPDMSFDFEPDVNIIFAHWARSAHQRAQAGGAAYYIMDGELEGTDPNASLGARLVCDWSASDENIDRFIQLVKGG